MYGSCCEAFLISCHALTCEVKKYGEEWDYLAFMREHLLQSFHGLDLVNLLIFSLYATRLPQKLWQ
jgi:hypothetical protein